MTLAVMKRQLQPHTQEKAKKKGNKNRDHEETPIDLAVDIRKSGMLNTSEQGWNSTQGTRIHIPNQ